MPLFPMFSDLSGRHVLVIGGGEVASRKIDALLHAGARVRVHAHELAPAVAGHLQQQRIERLQGEFDPAWIDPCWLVVAATNDPAFNRRVAVAAGERMRWVNVVDDAELSTYQVPAIVDRDPVLIAISSAGAAPMLVRRLRERLELDVDHATGALARLLARYRPRICERWPSTTLRRRWFDQMLDGELPARLREGDLAAAERLLEASLSEVDAVPTRGRVSLVGCGDGPDMLTIRALRLMNQADQLLVSEDVPAATLAMARRDASVGPLPSPDPDLAQALAALAEAGQRVVCLRPGVGFIDPPGRQLAAALRARGIACEQVNGPASPA
ncbi:NAD(P)-dependent oxidoreductase [Pseudoxanthomonas sp.]|uniref:NAD(P)-dependent oxidoreductase n=1 Tax=Pseudoxanthomonas sp. TaxID=1871049 RepID=UPI0026154F26|nr:NAD(P)-dependent oxidoreductase [Pseudoxanthomonas sp.]WDS36067.1 MAG: NAD(P)-dependent oxidoreductase [Pseudoxanthomonas sp.]